jgi:hypothetical protein
MKKFVQLFISASMFLVLPLAAVDEHNHPQQQDGAAAAVPKAPTASGNGSNMPAGPMAENMNKMREQMEQFRQTKDPKERERLMREHMQLMMGQMKMMDGMKMDAMKGGEMMKSCEAMGSGPQAGKSAANCMAMMQQRFGMMHEMMNHVLQQQEMMIEMLHRN